MSGMFTTSAVHVLGAFSILLGIAAVRADTAVDAGKADPNTSSSTHRLLGSYMPIDRPLSRVFKPRTPAAVDVAKAEYYTHTGRLYVEASYSGNQLGTTLSVQDAKDGKSLGTLKYSKSMGAYSGFFELDSVPKAVKVVANGVASGTRKVRAIKLQPLKPAVVVDGSRGR